MRVRRSAGSGPRIAWAKVSVAAVPRLGAVALAGAALALSSGSGLSEPPRGSSSLDLVVPPGAVGEPPRYRVENPPKPGTLQARLAAYVAKAAGAGVPRQALEAYVRAQEALGQADSGCGLRWSLLAAIGRVESDHGRYGGRSLLSDGTSSSPIMGLSLDGGRPGLAVIRDSDGGRLDGDTEYDRAVGPMQFLPSTWAYVGTDGDGDGVRDPHDIDDASAAAGRYLCAYGSLDTPAGLRDAVLRYNPSTEYANLVLRIMALYERGLSDELPNLGSVPSADPVPAPPLPPANMDPPPVQQAPRSSGGPAGGGGHAGPDRPGGSGGGGTERDTSSSSSPSDGQAEPDNSVQDVEGAPDPDPVQDTVEAGKDKVADLTRDQGPLDDVVREPSLPEDLTPPSVG